MAEERLPAGTIKIEVALGERVSKPLPGRYIPVFVCSDGRVTLDAEKGIEGMPAIGELHSVADDGCALVVAYRSTMSPEMQATLDGPNLVFHST